MKWVRILVFTLVSALCLVAIFLPSQDVPNLDATLQQPTAEHWLGTDELGRDVANRLIRAAGLSLGLSVCAWLTALMIGVTLGGIVGLHPQTTADSIVRWFIRIAYGTPFLIVLVGVLAVIGPSILHAYAILVLFAWAPAARQTRMLAMHVSKAPHVYAMKAAGFSTYQVVYYAILPTIIRPILLASLAVMPELLALDAALSFFGLGPPPPTPSLGKMVVDGLAFLDLAWWMWVPPVFALATLCLCLRVFVEDWSDDGTSH